MEFVLEKQKKINVIDLGIIDYEEALEIQEKLLKLRQENRIGDVLLILEHEPVITIGKRGNQSNILVPGEFLAEHGVKVCSIGRGGDVTYHGPGQIVGYPIMRFQDHVSGVRELVRGLEEIFIQLLEEDFRIKAGRDTEHPGVWVENDKITAIGLLIHSGVTMHGFALNVNNDLSYFNYINPCGIKGDNVMTSISELLGNQIEVETITESMLNSFSKTFGLRCERGLDKCLSIIDGLNG